MTFPMSTHIHFKFPKVSQLVMKWDVWIEPLKDSNVAVPRVCPSELVKAECREQVSSFNRLPHHVGVDVFIVT